MVVRVRHPNLVGEVRVGIGGGTEQPNVGGIADVQDPESVTASRKQQLLAEVLGVRPVVHHSLGVVEGSPFARPSQHHRIQGVHHVKNHSPTSHPCGAHLNDLALFLEGHNVVGG